MEAYRRLPFRPRSGGRWLLTAALALTCLCRLLQSSVEVAAAQTPPQVEVRQFGWQPGGNLASGTWNPLWVRITGSGTSEDAARVQAILRVNVPAATPGQPLGAPIGIYAQDLALPAGATKEVKLWLPLQLQFDTSYAVTIQLLGSDSQVLAEQTVTAQSGRVDAPLIASLADSPTLASQLGRIEVPFQQGLTAQVRAVDLAPADVPSRSEYLSAFQGLVVQGTAASTLTAEQKRAIQDWTGQGGHLVIVGGPDAQRAASVLDGVDAPELSFAGLNGSADLRPLATWAGFDPAGLAVTGAATRIQATGAEPLAGAASAPLAARGVFGAGTLTLLAADPTGDPLRGWDGTPALLRRALQPALATAAPTTPGQATQPATARSDELRLAAALDALPPDVFPDWQHVALLLGLFAFVAGPVLHIVLWRIGHRPWLWVAVPALSLVVTAGIYVATAAQPGHDVVANAITDVRLDTASGDARQAIAVGFFAPLHDQLTVRLPADVPVRVALGTDNQYVQLSGFQNTTGVRTISVSGQGFTYGPPFTIVNGRETQVDFAANQYTQNGLRSLVFNRALPRGAIGQIENDLHVEGTDGIIQGTVRNATPYQLDQVALAVGQTLAKLGPMAPGQTTSVTFDPSIPPPTAPGNFVYSFGWQLYGVPSPTVRGSGSSVSLDLPNDPDVRRRVRVMDAVFSPGDRNAFISYSGSGAPIQRATSVRPMVIAVSRAAIGGDVLPTAGAQRTFQLTVIQAPIHLSVGPGAFTVSGALVAPLVTLDQGASLTPANGDPAGYAWLDLRGGATYTFRTGLPASARVSSLTLTTQQSTTPPPTATVPVPAPASRSDRPGPSAAGTFSIFNWESAVWQPLVSGQTSVDVAPSGLVGPDGSVRVRVTSPGADRSVRFLAPQLTIHGEASS